MKKKFTIEIFEIGMPGIIIKSFTLGFDNVLDAVTFAESIVKIGEGFNITD